MGWGLMEELIIGLDKRFADLRWAGFLPLNFMRSTKFSAATKLSADYETLPIANMLLCVVIIL